MIFIMRRCIYSVYVCMCMCVVIYNDVRGEREKREGRRSDERYSKNNYMRMLNHINNDRNNDGDDVIMNQPIN